VKSEISQVRNFAWHRSQFCRLRVCSCSKIFESGTRSGSGSFSNMRIRLLFRLRLPSVQLGIYPYFTKEITKQTPATAKIKKWPRIWVRFVTNVWLRDRKKSAESCRSRLRHVGVKRNFWPLRNFWPVTVCQAFCFL